MKHIEFDIGNKVVTIKDGELRKGVVKYCYPIYPPVFAVEFEDGTVEKVHYNNIAPEPKTETPEERIEPVEKSEITITPDEFSSIAARIIVEETGSDVLTGLRFASIIGKLREALFVDEWEHENFLN